LWSAIADTALLADIQFLIHGSHLTVWHRPGGIEVFQIGRLTGTGPQSIFNRLVEYRIEVLDKVFRAIADPTRRAILAALAQEPATGYSLRGVIRQAYGTGCVRAGPFAS
jgi:hypothetical protein